MLNKRVKFSQKIFKNNNSGRKGLKHESERIRFPQRHRRQTRNSTEQFRNFGMPSAEFKPWILFTPLSE